jgi:Zn-dependent peptidase ImmA (M78 family)/formiminotetrahydrofolate cyclodeaminase
MDKYLLELSANELLKKFGAGEHKPGSGSAAAFQGMLSAKLIHTVISLTNDHKHLHRYSNCIDDLLKADAEIQNRIYPKLEELFHEDSAQFDKVITLRRSRNEAETNSVERKIFSIEAFEALIPATEIPIQIAELCEELAGFGLLVFDQGFKSARGDSGVALTGAISAVAGCLSIIQLNLLSFTPDEWTKNITSKTKNLRSRYENLSIEISNSLDKLQREVSRKADFHAFVENFKNKKGTNSFSSNTDIEALAIQFQRFIWKYRDEIWKDSAPQNPLDILNPENAIKIIGYQFNRETTLGQHEVNGKFLEVAGLIDNQTKEISISEQFSAETQRFTAAHELGHAMLHKQNVLHRDRALDGSHDSPVRDKTEYQADKFATYFLMPKKQVLKTFTSIFLTQKFVINDETAFAFKLRSVDELVKECSSLRGLSRKLASVESYNGKHFTSIAKRFNVSVETMAIRLEELDLLEI